MKLINKAAVIAEIERLDALYHTSNDLGGKLFIEGLSSFLNTLEVKKVDLEKEFSQWWKDERAKDYNVDILYERYPNVSMKLARHFFELGLKQSSSDKYKLIDS